MKKPATAYNSIQETGIVAEKSFAGVFLLGVAATFVCLFLGLIIWPLLVLVPFALVGTLLMYPAFKFGKCPVCGTELTFFGESKRCQKCKTHVFLNADSEMVLNKNPAGPF